MNKNSAYNVYGDQRIQCSAGLGVDIASQRMDDLDRESLKWVLEQEHSPTVVDLGAGAGGQSIRFAALGCTVQMIDLLTKPESVQACNQLLEQEKLLYLQKNINHLVPADLPESIDMLYSQRFLHYLPFADACFALQIAADRMPVGARAFISASGIDSELGNAYAGRKQPLEERFGTLAPEMAERHLIYAPVCLYSENDLEQLATEAGFRAVAIWKSAFGNIKAILERVSIITAQ